MGGKRKMNKHERVQSIIDDLGGPTAVGDIKGIDMTKFAVSMWAQRGAIPQRYWPVLRKHGITLERLAGVE